MGHSPPGLPAPARISLASLAPEMTSTPPRLAPAGILIAAALVICASMLLGQGAAEGQGGPTCFGEEATLAYPDTEFVYGGPGPDVIVTDGRVQIIDGEGGADRICAGGGSDVIAGGVGRDKVDGQSGIDNIVGGPGSDRLHGGVGRDLLNGNKGGKDRCIGGRGFDLASPKNCEFVRSAATRL
jgi:RTX calcium-binding nonapeptide repeat (4 copies)